MPGRPGAIPIPRFHVNPSLSHPSPSTLSRSAAVRCNLIGNSWEEGRRGSPAASPYLFPLRAAARRLPRGTGNISGSQLALPLAPVLRAGFPVKNTLLIPGGSPRHHILHCFPLHIAPLLWMHCCFPGHHSLPFERGFLGGSGCAA